MCAITDQLFRFIGNLFRREPKGGDDDSPTAADKSQANSVANGGKTLAGRKEKSTSRRVA